MLSGSTLSPYHIGARIGQGSFGEIYVVRNVNDNQLYALKVEQANTSRKILEFEVMVLKKINPSPFFPTFIACGQTQKIKWYVMELLGPSLATVVHRLPSHRLSLSTGLRVSSLVLRGIKAFHEKGFIHRDIKPSNILLRRSREFPIAIIDFGLSKQYIDRKNGQIIPARAHPGFRGTAVYASPNAHMHQDLGRRDDLISWYYMIIDLLSGSLPWRTLETRAEILHLKRKIPMSELGETILPQIGEIWKIISILKYQDRPDYEKIDNLLSQAMEQNEIHDDDEWEWHPQILQMDGNDETFLNQQRKSTSSSSREVMEEMQYVKKKYNLSKQPLLRNREEEVDNCCCLLL